MVISRLYHGRIITQSPETIPSQFQMKPGGPPAHDECQWSALLRSTSYPKESGRVGAPCLFWRTHAVTKTKTSSEWYPVMFPFPKGIILVWKDVRRSWRQTWCNAAKPENWTNFRLVWTCEHLKPMKNITILYYWTLVSFGVSWKQHENTRHPM